MVVTHKINREWLVEMVDFSQPKSTEGRNMADSLSD